MATFSAEKIIKTHSSKALSVWMRKLLVFPLVDLPKVTQPGMELVSLCWTRP